ncbi:MAG TPA: peptidoglycan hydrolase, partial [Thermomicrobiales bacterium]|nr:peptidoglycan hydrolase [Thermomicrobiales bacterium]
FGFREFWLKHGGVATFGYPISEEFDELNPDTGNVHTVQYFERARFEYHPEHAGTEYAVLLGLLIRDDLQESGWLWPEPDSLLPTARQYGDR